MLRLLCCLGIVATGLAENAIPQDQYSVGVTQIDVTPDYPVRLNGFGSRRDETAVISQRLWATALAISRKDEPPVVILTLDNLGVRESMVDQIAAELLRDFAVPRENLAVTFTHTHCAPKVRGASDTIFSTPIPPEHQAHIDQYTAELTEKLIAVSRQAIEARVPARLEWGVGEVTFAMNRRTPGGPVDHSLPVLVAKDTAGKPLAIYVTYACHCVSMTFNEINGDWAGYAREHIADAFPGCIPMVSIGCGSDANPSARGEANIVIASDQGREIAAEVERLLMTDLQPLEGDIVARLTHVDLPLAELPTREQLEEIAGQGGSAGFNAQSQLARLDVGEPLLSAVHYPVQSMAIGDDLLMVFLAGEICVDYAIRLRETLDRDRLWLHGYSNDFCGYIPSERLLQEGGYGGGGEIFYFDWPAPLRPGVEQLVIDAVLEVTPAPYIPPDGTKGIPPKSPADSMRCMQTHPELAIELVAAEPLIADPVAIDFGTDGRLWVAEMPDYTREVDEDFTPTGRIRCLFDDDGDARFDRSEIFLDGLRFPMDVKVWRDGVLICDAPDILFAADRDGDGKAEIREVWYTGFATHNPHGRVNGLRFGLDGWVHGSGGLFGGQIRTKTGQVVDLGNRDFRIKPDEGLIEGVMGVTQQGRPRDDWDNWFGCTNSQLLLHYPMREEYARRNPHVTLPPTIVSVPDAAHGEQLFPPKDLVLFKLSGAPGRPTSACGAEIYRDVYLGDEYYGNAFVCEPVNQLVHRMVLTPKGCTFTGSRHPSEQQSEFLTSTDRWFRPVQVRTGPDGALWIVDMYRFVIEHPRWIPPETIQELDVMAGQNLGRIYRVVRKDVPAPTALQLNGLTDEDLAIAIDSANGIQRDLAEQMMIWRQPTESPLGLELILRTGVTPAARIQAASTLAALGKLGAKDVRLMLKDESGQVQRLAVRFAEPLLESGRILSIDLFRLVNDEPIRTGKTSYSIAVLAQIANSGFPEIIPILYEALLSDNDVLANDPYLQSAILSSIEADSAVYIFDQLLRCGKDWPGPSRKNGKRRDAWFDQFGAQVARTVASTVPDNEFHELFRLAFCLDQDLFSEIEFTGRIGDLDLNRSWRLMSEMLDAIENRQLNAKNCIGPDLSEAVAALVRSAIDSLAEKDVADDERVAAIRFVARRFDSELARGWEVVPERLFSLMGPMSAPEVQSAAIKGLLRCQVDNSAKVIVKQWPSWTPRLRQEAIDIFLTRDVWTIELVNGLDQKIVQLGDFDAARRQRLLEHPNADIKARAEKLFGSVAAPNELVAAWEPALQLAGDAERGRAVYAKLCASCHILEGVGFEVGPDLAAVTTLTPSSILISMLDPNREVDGRYLSYSALRQDGKTVSGMLVAETSTTVTIREQGGKDHVILRNELDELRTARKSVMPEGIEKDLDHQAMADLIEYLMAGRKKN